MILTPILSTLRRRLIHSTHRYIKTIAQAETEAQELLDSLYSVVRAQRFSKIVVIQTKFNANPRYLLLANAFNARHLVNGTLSVNKEFKSLIKSPEHDFAQLSISQEWNVLDVGSVVLHLFLESCRNYYDIEQLWTVGDKYDDLVQGTEVNTVPRRSGQGN